MEGVLYKYIEIQKQNKAKHNRHSGAEELNK